MILDHIIAPNPTPAQTTCFRRAEANIRKDTAHNGWTRPATQPQTVQTSIPRLG
jgi:hypothetical protein